VSSYWLDTDILVWAKNSPYPFDSRVGAEFWKLMEEGFKSGRVKMSNRVYKEITEGREEKDQLASWLSIREHLCLPTTKEIYAFSREIANYLYGGEHGYAMRWVNRFATGADAWAIAYAAVDRGAVATREESAPKSKKPKIPDVCKHFNVKCIHLPKLVFCLENGISADHCTDPYKD
jgi:hypothetical protein